MLLLTTKGRKTGEPRTTPLIYGRSGDDYVIVASKGGSDEPPGWYANLQEDPEVEVQVLDDASRRAPARRHPRRSRRCGSRWSATGPTTTRYQEQTDREIPVVVLERQLKSLSLMPMLALADGALETTIVYVLIWVILFPVFVQGLIAYAVVIGRGEKQRERREPPLSAALARDDHGDALGRPVHGGEGARRPPRGRSGGGSAAPGRRRPRRRAAAAPGSGARACRARPRSRARARSARPSGAAARAPRRPAGPTCTWRPRLRSERIEAAAVAALPIASIERWAPPPVSSRIASTAPSALDRVLGARARARGRAARARRRRR